MAYQRVFKRYELKYLLTPEQKALVLAAMQGHMQLDQYGRTTIRNIYFDTENYRLIRRSLEKPAYKEKLRIRSYRRTEPDRPVFVELKKKYDGVVYKRRVAMEERQALDWLCGTGKEPDTQIGAEIDYFMRYYQSLRPMIFLSYEREAYYCFDGEDFRVTFDENILARQEELSLGAPVWGRPILPEDRVLMEIKTSGGIPLWMTGALTEGGIYKTSYSKYGTAYQTMIFPSCKGDFLYA